MTSDGFMKALLVIIALGLWANALMLWSRPRQPLPPPPR